APSSPLRAPHHPGRPAARRRGRGAAGRARGLQHHRRGRGHPERRSGGLRRGAGQPHPDRARGPGGAADGERHLPGRRAALDRRFLRPGGRRQRLGLVVRSLPGRGPGAAAGQRGDAGPRPVRRDHHPRQRPGPGPRVRARLRHRLPEHLRPRRQGAAAVRRHPAALGHPLDPDHRRAGPAGGAGPRRDLRADAGHHGRRGGRGV
ncbi:MAG: Thiol:disulfide oxidoreductase related to ResA, partial [uncultured Friedmanniella sp.]